MFAQLTPDQEQDNYLYDFYRARVEQVNTQCAYSHEMFLGRPFLGSFHDLRAYADITINASALLIREFEPSRLDSALGLGHFRIFQHSKILRGTEALQSFTGLALNDALGKASLC